MLSLTSESFCFYPWETIKVENRVGKVNEIYVVKKEEEKGKRGGRGGFITSPLPTHV